MWPGSALKVWAEQQQSREDDRFALDKAQTPATVQADWADRPSQALHGEQPGRDRAANHAYTTTTMHASEPAPHPAT